MKYNAKDEDLCKKYPYFERLLEEYFETNERLTKLKEFVENSNLFNNLSDTEKDLLKEQSQVMENLVDILSKRIEIVREKN